MCLSYSRRSLSNLIRNVIVKERKNQSQRTNRDGNNEPLERFTKALFDSRKDVFDYREHCKFKYNHESGEVDLIAWTEHNLYLIECKNSILPTSPFELRTTYDYIRKAEKQLDLSGSALRDENTKKYILGNWGIPIRDYEVHTLIVLGNRIFTSPNGFRHPVRYVHEMDMVFTGGYINSSFGKWRYWKNEEFDERDFLKFISVDDPLANDFFEAMTSYKMAVSVGEKRVERESYSLNILKHWELDDRNLVNMSTDEHMVMRANYSKKHNEMIEYIKSQNFIKNMPDLRTILTTDSTAAKRTIERIRLHQSSLSPDFLMLFPQGTIEEQQVLMSKYSDDMDPIEFWKVALNL